MKKFLSIALCAVMVLGILAGCGQKGNDTPKNNDNSTALSGSVSTNGSTSMDKVIGALKEQFTADNPNVTVTYDPTGSGAGIEAVKNGSEIEVVFDNNVNIGLTSTGNGYKITKYTITDASTSKVKTATESNCSDFNFKVTKEGVSEIEIRLEVK